MNQSNVTFVDNNTGQYYNFTTEAVEGMILEVSGSSFSKDVTYFITGKSTPGAEITIYVNRKDNPLPAGITTSEGNKTFIYTVPESGEFTLSIYLFRDASQNYANNIEIEAVKDGVKIIEKIKTTYDIQEPVMNYRLEGDYVNDENTKVQILMVEDNLDENVMLEIFADGKKLKEENLNTRIRGRWVNFALPGTSKTKDYLLQFKLIDSAGNINTYDDTINIDKSIDPKITIDKDVSRSPVHSVFYVVKGKTEAYAKIRVMNLGNFTSLDEYKRRQNTSDFEASLQISPAALLLGTSGETDANAEGEFSSRIALRGGKNLLVILATDRAGNNDTYGHEVDVELGDANWRIRSSVETPPLIYTSILRAGDEQATVQFEIQWVGPDDIKPRATREVSVDARKTGQDVYNNKLFDVKSSKIKQWFDPSTGILLVEVPIAIKKMPKGGRKGIDEYFEQLFTDPAASFISKKTKLSEFEKYLRGELNLFVRYQKAGSPWTGNLYREITYVIHRPEDIAKFLSPKLIERSIKFLNTAINVTQKAINVTRTLLVISIFSCVAALASSFFLGANDPLGTLFKAVTPGKGESMFSAVHWTCDRIICPDVPPKAETPSTELCCITIALPCLHFVPAAFLIVNLVV